MPSARITRSANQCAAPTTTTPSGPARSGVRYIPPDEADKLLELLLGIIQTWRPICYPVKTYPLAIADARSGRPTTCDPVGAAAIQDRIDQTYAIAYNPGAPMVLLPRRSRARGAGVQGLRRERRLARAGPPTTAVETDDLMSYGTEL